MFDDERVKDSVTVGRSSPWGARREEVQVRKAATIRDVAKAAEVSVSVVSRVLNGTGPVAAATRLRVVRAMDELGYRPREIDSALSQAVGQVLDPPRRSAASAMPEPAMPSRT